MSSTTQASTSSHPHTSPQFHEEAKAADKRWQDECIQDLTAPWLGNNYPTYDAAECHLLSEYTTLLSASASVIPPPPCPRPATSSTSSTDMASKLKGPPPIDPNRPLLFQPLQTLSPESWAFYEKQEALDRRMGRCKKG